MKSRGIFAIVAAFVAGIARPRVLREETDNLNRDTSPIVTHHHARGAKKTTGAFGKAKLSRLSRNLDRRAVAGALAKRHEILSA